MSTIALSRQIALALSEDEIESIKSDLAMAEEDDWVSVRIWIGEDQNAHYNECKFMPGHMALEYMQNQGGLWQYEPADYWLDLLVDTEAKSDIEPTEGSSINLLMGV